ncbi:MAG: hypothetical protein AB7T06_21685 [Kofleriaceae bacterium]
MSPGLAAPRLFVCVLVATLQVAAPALAQPAPVTPPESGVVGPRVRRPVAVVNLDLTGNRDLVDLSRAITKALEVHSALRPLDLAGSLFETIVDPDEDHLRKARKAEREAMAELDNGRFPDADEIARRGQEELLLVTPSQAVQLYAQLAFVRGKALLGTNQIKEAREQFSLSQRLDPARPLDRKREPPDVVAAYDAASSAAAPIGKIEIETKGTVWIDGSEKGFAPNQYVIASGLHVVWVTHPDRATSGVEIDVKPGQTEATKANVPELSASPSEKLQRARQAVARAPDDGAKIIAMKRVAEVTVVKDAVVLSLANGKIVYQTWRSDDADRAPGFSPKHERNPRDPIVKVFDDLLPPPVEEDPPGVVFPIPIDDTRWYQKPSYWAGIAFGTSLVAVGAYFLITSLLPDTVQGPGDIGLSRPEDRVLR